MVLIIFFVMMLNLGPETTRQERQWLRPGMWAIPTLLCLVLLGELVYLIAQGKAPTEGIRMVSPKAVGQSLFGPYILAVELSAMLLMAGIVGAYHLGRQKPRTLHRFFEKKVS
jgi:NADH-quinone oxidoreductase subunit J